MIEIICNDETFTYNTYHIAKAFYPSEEVKTRVEEKASHYVEAVFSSGDIIGISPEETAEYLEADEGKSDSPALKKECKYRVDILFYRKLQAYAGRSLAWGILTGVRPTKIAMKKLGEGMEEETFVPWFMEECLVSKEKARLSWQIAKREKALLDKLDYKEGYSLYVGIPFCPTVCTYCSFSSGSLKDWGHKVEDYLRALCKELAFIGAVSKNKKLNTIYIGGGTPTSLTAEQLERLLTCIDVHFSREHLIEYTVEAGRPDSITKEKLEVIRSHGVTRISINPQTMQQKTLDSIGRKHRVEDIVETYKEARALGFDNINMDLIAGLPGETLADVEDTLRRVEALCPDSLTVHSLAIKRAARMGQEQKSGKLKVCDGTENVSGSEYHFRDIGGMIEASAKTAHEMGLSPYYLYRQKNIAGNFENVGYAKVDKAGIYNILIMEEKQSIVAAGAGSSTKIVLKEPVILPGNKKGKETNLIRLENVKAIDAYIDRIDEMIERKGEWLWR